MTSIRSLLLHPVLTLSPWDDQGGIDVLYLLAWFFATGIWLVFRRYQRFVNGAIDFTVEAPEVRICEPLLHFLEPTLCPRLLDLTTRTSWSRMRTWSRTSTTRDSCQQFKRPVSDISLASIRALGCSLTNLSPRMTPLRLRGRSTGPMRHKKNGRRPRSPSGDALSGA
jgi:hypothetical protein